MPLPPCGIYRTGLALEGKEAAVPADQLVYFHNHSTQGPPVVLLPEGNTHNRWRFQERGYLVDTPNAAAFVSALVPLPLEGCYVVTQALAVTDRVLAPGTLVQIGYEPHGRPIVFPAAWEANGLSFPSKGFRFDDVGVVARHLRHAGFGPPGTPMPSQPGAASGPSGSSGASGGVPPTEGGPDGGPTLH